MYGAYSVLCERDMMQREVDVALWLMACTLYMTIASVYRFRLRRVFEVHGASVSDQPGRVVFANLFNSERQLREPCT